MLPAFTGLTGVGSGVARQHCTVKNHRKRGQGAHCSKSAGPRRLSFVEKLMLNLVLRLSRRQPDKHWARDKAKKDKPDIGKNRQKPPQGVWRVCVSTRSMRRRAPRRDAVCRAKKPGLLPLGQWGVRASKWSSALNKSDVRRVLIVSM